MKLSIKNIAKIINADTDNLSDIDITSISTDTRTTKPGDCFFAIKGHNHNAEDYLQAAFEKGAACAVISKSCQNQNFPNLLKVDNTTTALADLATEYRNLINTKVIAITGSVGKTTTRHIIAHVLNDHYKIHQSPKNFNNNIGLPLSILSAPDDTEIMILELGTNAPGEIQALSHIAKPDIALITAITPAHLEGFKTLENIITEKAAIAAGLTPNGKLLINQKHTGLIDHLKKFKTALETFTSENIKTNGLDGTITVDNRKIYIPLPGLANLENALIAYHTCKHFGITTDQFADSIKTIKPFDMRLQPETAGPLTIINDCYNANPASMQNAVALLSNLKQKNNSRAIFICGPMLELGDDSKKLHAELGKFITKQNIDILLCVGQFADITAKNTKLSEKHTYKSTAELLNNLHQFVIPDDIILIKGSRSAKLEDVADWLKDQFA